MVAMVAALNAEPLLLGQRFEMPSRLTDERSEWPPAYEAFDRIVREHGFLEWNIPPGRIGTGRLSEPVLAFQMPNADEPEFVVLQLRSADLRSAEWTWRLYERPHAYEQPRG